ncbi:hypothetical protein HanIR_Chr14g0708961 [Helianthus annuus]|nr:hypothetical protein HanIR_Chr14g0708961 [Helianthus annuus]
MKTSHNKSDTLLVHFRCSRGIFETHNHFLLVLLRSQYHHTHLRNKSYSYPNTSHTV